MSEKVIDPCSLLKLVRPDADPRARRLFEMRLEEEQADEESEARQAAMTMGAPPIPDAQLVYNASSHSTGVAIRGARFICPLPKGYGGPGCELAMIPGNKLIVVQPDKPALVIEPRTGTTRRL